MPTCSKLLFLQGSWSQLSVLRKVKVYLIDPRITQEIRLVCSMSPIWQRCTLYALLFPLWPTFTELPCLLANGKYYQGNRGKAEGTRDQGTISLAAPLTGFLEMTESFIEGHVQGNSFFSRGLVTGGQPLLSHTLSVPGVTTAQLLQL